MSFEYLIVGIAKNEERDYREFYDKTKVEAYMFALSIVKDRVLARDITVEAYKRVKTLAYKFDTELNAEYWILDIVKNLSFNSLKHDELRKVADTNRVDNLSRILSDLILNTKEDRAKFIVLRTASGLGNSEISRLLWYKGGSASAEYRRGLKELVELAPEDRSKNTIKQELIEDMNSCTPDMWGLVIKEDDTRVSFVSHQELDIDDDEISFSEDEEDLLKIKRAADRKRRKIKIFTVIIGIVLLCALVAGIITAYVISNDDSKTVPGEQKNPVYDIILPQFRTKIAMAEIDGNLYFANYADGGKLYKADFSSGSAILSKISDDVPKNIVVCDSDEKYLVYRNDDGNAYRYSPSKGETVLLYENVGAMCGNGDTLYFNISSVGICSLSVSKGASSFKEEWVNNNGQNLPSVIDLELDSSGKMYFSSAADEDGIFVKTENIDETTGEIQISHDYLKLSGDVGNISDMHIYDMHFYNDCIYFDISGNNTSALYKIDLKNDNEVSYIENVYLSSAAIYVSDGYIYYAGYADDPKVNKNVQRGLFRVSVDGGTPEILTVQPDDSLYISDMYISDSKIYCYSCTAEKDGAKKLVGYLKDGLNTENFEAKSIVIF